MAAEKRGSKLLKQDYPRMMIAINKKIRDEKFSSWLSFFYYSTDVNTETYRAHV